MKKYMTLNDSVDLMNKCMPEISDEIVKLAFCYWKMTIFDEMIDKERYEKLEFVEFLEFIGRIASTLTPLDVNKKLYPRVERVLQRMLALIKEKVKYSTNDIDLLSESDSEPYKH